MISKKKDKVFVGKETFVYKAVNFEKKIFNWQPKLQS